MGKTTGFLEYPREEMTKEQIDTRVHHNSEFEKPLYDSRVRTQAARCMDCGIPFCNWGCPVKNLIPEFNDFVFQDQWKDAYGTLQSTNNFPEFTGRICPAPCEPACTVDIVEKPVSIKQIEFAIIEKAYEKGWVRANKNIVHNGKKIAVIGSGPAGLAAAAQLNLAGHFVTVFDKNQQVGGLLRYGIPDFKLEKSVVERRVSILKEEGITFKNGYEIGKDTPVEDLQRDFDVIALCCGAEHPRPLDIDGNDKAGIHYAMDFLTQHNRRVSKEPFSGEEIWAEGKHVVVIGGGDTGSDCVGTGIRQGCKSMTQIQLHKTPPLQRYATNPWPYWPKTFSTSSSQEEGCRRDFSALTESILGNGKVEKLHIRKLIWPKKEIKSGNRDYQVSDEIIEIPCDLLLISLGFMHTFHKGLVESLQLETDAKGNIKTEDFKTSADHVFASGDMIEGANLVVTAIASGREMARAIDESIKGYSNLS